MNRRSALFAVAGVGITAWAEYASLSGRFDHRIVRLPSAGHRYAASVARLDAEPVAAAGGLVHLGHSTHLLSVAGVRVLTDPWFYDPAFGALSHVAGPAVSPEDVGRLEAIVVSHDHPDHVDTRAVDRLDKRAHVFVSASPLAARIRALGFAAVDTIAPWETATLGPLRITGTPAEHDIYEVGFALQGADRTVYFGGDTRLFAGVHEIAERFRPDLALLPVDGTRVRTAPLYVMTPDDAVEAARILGAKAAVPSHAEALITDPIAKYALTTTVDGAADIFVDRMARRLPHVRSIRPLPGDIVVF